MRKYIADDNPAAALALDELFEEKSSRLPDHLVDAWAFVAQFVD